MFDPPGQLGVDFASGLSAYYEKREAHYRRLADAAQKGWLELHGLAVKYRLLAEQASALERIGA